MKKLALFTMVLVNVLWSLFSLHSAPILVSSRPHSSFAEYDFETYYESSSTEWNKTFGGADSEWVNDAVQTADGGFALAGVTYSFGAGSSDFWLVKTDSNGIMQWNKTYGGTGGAYGERPYSVIQTTDGGYIVLGITDVFGAGGMDGWLVKTDSSGNIQWNKTYGGSGTDWLFSVIQTADGGYALAGYTFSFSAEESDGWLVKTDSSGNIQWNKTYSSGVLRDDFSSVIQTTDGGYALVGVTWWVDNWVMKADGWLVKTDSSGNMQWNKKYGGEDYYESFESVIQTADGGYALISENYAYITLDDDDLWLVKTDSSGNIQWNKTYGGIDDEATIRGQPLIQIADGGYVLAGSTKSFGAGSDDLWLVKTDSTGNIEGHRAYGGTNSDAASAVFEASDGLYVLAGWTSSFGAGSFDFWLVKIAPESIHDVAVTSVIPLATSVVLGETLSINVTVKNQGPVSETFTVIVYVNTNSIETQAVTDLVGGAAQTLTFIWNTTGFAVGEYTIKAVASSVPGEEELTNNTFIDGAVTVITPVHDVAITNVTPSQTEVGQGSSLSVSVTAENQGNLAETFDVTLYANTTTVATQTITNLGAGVPQTLNFDWNTTGWNVGDYTVKALASTVSGETETTDNTYINGIVTIVPIYTLTITTTLGGTTSPSPGIYTYLSGTVVSVSATPSSTHYFLRWEVDGVYNTTNPISVSMDTDHTLHVVFVYDVTIDAYCYTEATAMSVGITKDGIPTGFSTSHTFTSLTGTHTFTVPNTDPNGHPFKQWNTGETTTTITVSSEGTYTAYYQAKYTLTITATTGGTTNPAPGTYTYWDGTVVSVTAMPNTGYYFDHWELDGVHNTTNPISVTMDTDHTLHAVFLYDVTIEAYCYTEGKYVSVNITMDGSPTGYNTSHTFTGLTGTLTFTIPSADANGHAFYRWNIGSTSTTITVTTGGKYTAYYGIPPQPVSTGGGDIPLHLAHCLY